MNRLLIAQNNSSLDVISRPTFPYNGPFQGGGASNVVKLDMVSNNASPKNGDTIRIDLTLTTNTTAVKEYKIKLNFPAALAQELDFSDTVSGDQINFMETVLNKTQNTVNNTTGTIEITATGNTATTINRKIGEISFKLKNTGAFKISSDNTVSGITLTDGSKQTITINDLNLNILSITASSQSSSASSANSSLSSTSNTSLPGTALGEELPMLLIYFITIVGLIGGGVMGLVRKKKYS